MAHEQRGGVVGTRYDCEEQVMLENQLQVHEGLTFAFYFEPRRSTRYPLGLSSQRRCAAIRAASKTFSDLAASLCSN